MQDEVIERLRPAPFVRAAPQAERDAKLPGLGDPYQAAGLPENGEPSRLALVMGKDGFKAGGTAYRFLQYVHIGLGEFGFVDDGHWFRFIWSDLQPKLVTVRGRNLLRICDYVSMKRMPWIRVADRDFRIGSGVEGAEPIITGIEFADWVRTPEG
jgi:hypothetical protein